MGRRTTRHITRHVIEKNGEKLFFRVSSPGPAWGTEDEASKFRNADTAAAYLREFGLEGEAHVRERHYRI